MTQSIKTYNIANNSIKSFVFGPDVSNTINAASIASTVAISANVAAQAVNTFVTLQTLQVANTPPTINVISITDSSYNVLDDTAANTGGAYLQITGSNFQSGAIVMVGSSNTALTTTLVNSNTLRAQIPAIASGTYPVYVVNSNGGTAIRVNGLTTSSFPVWGTGTTLTGQNNAVSFAITLSANSDSSITYSNTTALPAGTTLLANGYFYGTVNVVATTTYNFTVNAKDTENQDASRTFGITITLPPPQGLFVWGQNFNGALGLNLKATTYYNGNRSSPTQVGALTTWSSVSSYGRSFVFDASASIKTDGTLWVWGKNDQGQLGLNDKVDRSSPVQIGALTNWSKINVSQRSMYAVKTDGTLWSWGSNGSGQLGQNNNITRSSPVQIGALTTWSLISGGAYHVHAIKTDGTLWAWGYNNNGCLGTNLSDTATTKSSPIQIGALNNWSKVNGNNFAVLAVKTDGTLWSWGQNNTGQLGLNITTTKSSPTQIGTDTNWLNANQNYMTTLATKTNGTMWGWGRNAYGNIGDGTAIDRSSPVQIGTDTNWNLISTGVYNNLATKTNGTLWTWGWNNFGELGLNNLDNKNIPTQIGTGTNWTSISTTGYFNLAIAT